MAHQCGRVGVSPRTGRILGCLGVAFFAAVAIVLIDRGRGPPRAWWPTAVLGGAGASAGLIALMAASLVFSRGRRALVRLGEGLAITMGLVASAGLVVIRAGGPVTSPWQVGLAAAFLPVAGLALVVIPWLTWPAGRPDPRRHLTATITARQDGWPVTWSGLGRTPGPLHAATLTAAADLALAAAERARPPGTVILRTVIYPGRRRGGPWFDITGTAGDLTSSSIRDPGRAYRGATLEDLIAAIEPSLPARPEGLRLRWTRQITPPAASAHTPEQVLPGDQRPPGDNTPPTIQKPSRPRQKP